jgi:hypothetical protein
VDKAVTVTVLPLGRISGAVKMVVAPLAVWGGEKDPQLGALPHIATQSTPAFATSFETVADTMAVPPTSRLGGRFCCIRVMEIVGVGVADSPVTAQPAMAMAVKNKKRTDRCAPQRRVLDASFFPESNEEPLPVEPDSPQNDEPRSLQLPRLIIRTCPFRQFKAPQHQQTRSTLAHTDGNKPLIRDGGGRVFSRAGRQDSGEHIPRHLTKFS